MRQEKKKISNTDLISMKNFGVLSKTDFCINFDFKKVFIDKLFILMIEFLGIPLKSVPS